MRNYRILLALFWLTPLLAFAQRAGPFNLNTVGTSGLNSCATIIVPPTNASTVYIDVSGTFSLTLQASVQNSAGIQRNVQVTASSARPATGDPTTITAAGGYYSGVGPVEQFNLCVSAYTSGTAVVYLNVGSGLASGAGGGGGGSSGTVTPSPQFQVGIFPNSGTAAVVAGSSGVTTDANSNLNVTPSTGSSTFTAPDLGASPITRYFKFGDASTSNTDTTFNLGASTGTTSYHHAFETDQDGFYQFRSCSIEGASHVGEILIGDSIGTSTSPACSFYSNALNTTQTAKVWMYEKSHTSVLTLIADNTSASFGSIFRMRTSQAAATTFKAFEFCTGMTSSPTGDGSCPTGNIQAYLDGGGNYFANSYNGLNSPIYISSTTPSTPPVPTTSQDSLAPDTSGIYSMSVNGGSFSELLTALTGITSLTADVTTSGFGASTATVVGFNGVPKCTTFSPTNGQVYTYTTGGSPNPCIAPTTVSGSFTAGGDLSGTSISQTVKGIDAVPLCTGFTPTNGQVLEYTTGSSPNPCYTAAASSGATGGYGTSVSGTVITNTLPGTKTDVAPFPGSTLDAKVTAAVAAELSTGGVLDLGNLHGAQSFAASVTLSIANTTVLIPDGISMTPTSSSVTSAFTVTAANVTIQCANEWGSLFDWSGVNVAGTTNAIINVTGSAAGTFRLQGCHLKGDRVANSDGGAGQALVRVAPGASNYIQGIYVTDNFLEQAGSYAIDVNDAGNVHAERNLMYQCSTGCIQFNTGTISNQEYREWIARNNVIYESNTSKQTGVSAINFINPNFATPVTVLDAHADNNVIRGDVIGGDGNGSDDTCNQSGTSTATMCGQGIEFNNITDGTITGNYIRNTNAEGVSIVNGGAGIVVANNTASLTGATSTGTITTAGAGCFLLFYSNQNTSANNAVDLYDNECYDSGYGVSLVIGGSVTTTSVIVSNVHIHHNNFYVKAQAMIRGFRWTNLSGTGCSGSLCTYTLQNVVLDTNNFVGWTTSGIDVADENGGNTGTPLYFNNNPGPTTGQTALQALAYPCSLGLNPIVGTPYCGWTLPTAIVITGIDMYWGVKPLTCSTLPVFEAWDITAGAEIGSFAITGVNSSQTAAQVTGATAVPAGHQIGIKYTTAYAGCGTNPTQGNSTLTYRTEY